MDLGYFYNIIESGIHSYDFDKVESPIEEYFLNHLEKFLSYETKVEVQYPLNTISGNFRGDIALINNEKVIIIECDGKEFHSKEKDKWYDEWRDSLILFERRADSIYRFKGTDIYNSVYSLIYVLYKYEPEFFEESYSNRLEKKEIHDYLGHRKTMQAVYVNDLDENIEYEITIERKKLVEDFSRYWLKYILFSMINPEKNVKELISIMRNEIYGGETALPQLIKKLTNKFPIFKESDVILLLKTAVKKL